MSNLITTQINELATRFDLPQSEELYNVLKATAFKGDVTDAQLSALLIVAGQYKLNPWTKEIYAFPDKGGIVPVVGVDGWSRIINSNPQFDGMDFEQDADSCTCTIYRKDRAHPTKLTEWMAECKRSGVKPWESHPYRMLRHKAMIQCARIAFGFGGIYDADEAERIIENTAPTMKQIDPATGEVLPDGQRGELVFTTLTKEAFPLLRYRTRDIAALEACPCDCGRTSIRMSRIVGRTDDMLIIRGVNVFPSQIEEALLRVEGTAPHYEIVIERPAALDEVTVRVEVRPEIFSDSMREMQILKEKLVREIVSVTGIRARVELVSPQTLQRTPGKAKRVIDLRKA